MTNENSKTRNNRRTRVEMKAALEAKLAKLQAQIDGNYDESGDDSFLTKRLRRAIRSRETALGVAETLLYGRAATEKSPAIGGIETKIQNAEKRLADLFAAKQRAIETQARVPFDIDALRVALTGAEQGTVLEMPTGLYILPGEKTDAEIEAASVVSNLDD